MSLECPFLMCTINFSTNFKDLHYYIHISVHIHPVIGWSLTCEPYIFTSRLQTTFGLTRLEFYATGHRRACLVSTFTQTHMNRAIVRHPLIELHLVNTPKNPITITALRCPVLLHLQKSTLHSRKRVFLLFRQRSLSQRFTTSLESEPSFISSQADIEVSFVWSSIVFVTLLYYS